MTDQVTSEPEAGVVEVTQADRNAAVRILEAGDQDWQAKEIRLGAGDHFPLVQAFARHRTATVARVEPVAGGTLANRVGSCLNFFRSVIKSGESWSETCERDFRAAHESLAALSTLSPASVGAGEPVAWQWRSRIKGGAWDAWENGRYGQTPPPFMDVEERALYASPATPTEQAEQGGAEVERLREALARIANGRTIRFTGSEHHGKPLRDKDAQAIARAALREPAREGQQP